MWTSTVSKFSVLVGRYLLCIFEYLALACVGINGVLAILRVLMVLKVIGGNIGFSNT